MSYTWSHRIKRSRSIVDNRAYSYVSQVPAPFDSMLHLSDWLEPVWKLATSLYMDLCSISRNNSFVREHQAHVSLNHLLHFWDYRLLYYSFTRSGYRLLGWGPVSEYHSSTNMELKLKSAPSSAWLATGSSDSTAVFWQAELTVFVKLPPRCRLYTEHKNHRQ